MKVYLNRIDGIADAMVSLLMSKRSWTREREEHIRDVVKCCTNEKDGTFNHMNYSVSDYSEIFEEFDKQMRSLIKWGKKHITLLKFIDLSITVEGLHRAGQDDWDAHAERFDNRIIRASTRLATFEGDEVSEWYKGKIMPMDVFLKLMSDEYHLPEEFNFGGNDWVRTTNGYIRKDLQDDRDVKRGLYMECIPSNFIFKVNLAQYAHVYKQRGNHGHANPEVKILAETICDELDNAFRHTDNFGNEVTYFTRELLMEIEN